MYFQCDPAEDAAAWSDERVWAELRARVNGNGFELEEGPIIQRGVIPMRSYVVDPMRHGRLFLAGDAAHTVPPTGAKGLNLAAADIAVLCQALERFFHQGSADLLESYGRTASDRVWRAQHFSWWMTSMLHTDTDADAFGRRRQLGEIDQVTESVAGSTFLAEAYTGWPIAHTNPDSVISEAITVSANRAPDLSAHGSVLVALTWVCGVRMVCGMRFGVGRFSGKTLSGNGRGGRQGRPGTAGAVGPQVRFARAYCRIVFGKRGEAPLSQVAGGLRRSSHDELPCPLPLRPAGLPRMRPGEVRRVGRRRWLACGDRAGAIWPLRIPGANVASRTWFRRHPLSRCPPRLGAGAVRGKVGVWFRQHQKG